MSFFEKAKNKLKSAYKSGAEFSQEMNRIKQKSQAEKIKVLKQKNEIARQQASIAHQKAMQNKYKQSSGGGLWGSGSSGGSGGFNALISPAPKSSRNVSNSLYGNNFNPGSGLAAVIGNPAGSHKKRSKGKKGKTIMIRI